MARLPMEVVNVLRNQKPQYAHLLQLFQRGMTRIRLRHLQGAP
jgi:hypothetical protein